MLGYFTKRLLLIIPTVWLIGSLVFLLSRLIPGSYSDIMREAEQSVVGGANLTLNRHTYLQQLRASGQARPLFYFSVQNRAQPDTLQLVFPVQHQYLLQNLVNRYGNWPVVAAYYHSLMHLAAATEKAPAVPRQIKERVQLLTQQDDPQVISFVLQELQTSQPTTRLPIQPVQYRFAQLQNKAQVYNLFIPRLNWHGSQNQYHQWLTGLLAGNLGRSLATREPVLQVLGEAIGNTLLLLVGSLILTYAASIQLALALNRWRYGQQPVLNALYLLDSTPLFIIAQLLFTYLAGPEYLDWFPAFGLGEEDDETLGFFDGLAERLPYLVLPAICLLLTSLPYITTQLYQTLHQVLNNQFIVTARAKGLPEKQVLNAHAFRNALLPLITLFTGSLPAIIAGVLVIEYIFVIPGTGQLLVNSVLSRDYPVIIGLVILMAVVQAVSYILADLLYFAVDPRTRVKVA